MFMAVMAARSVAERLVKIQKLSSLYHQEVEGLRRDAIKTTVNALWRRYRQQLRQGENLYFLDWLADRERLEHTFRAGTGGHGIIARRKWAIAYYKFLTRKELTFADDVENTWMFEALEEAINAKHDDPNWVIYVEAEVLPELVGAKQLSGSSFMFGKVERPTPDESNS